MKTATTAPPDDPPAIIGLRNYKHLAAHHGHDLSIVIYGGDASAALECDTCQSILIAFENTPGPEASLAALVALTRRHRIESRHVAHRLASTFARQAAAVNDEGLHAQLAYLLGVLGAQPARELIESIAAETRLP